MTHHPFVYLPLKAHVAIGIMSRNNFKGRRTGDWKVYLGQEGLAGTRGGLDTGMQICVWIMRIPLSTSTQRSQMYNTTVVCASFSTTREITVLDEVAIFFLLRRRIHVFSAHRVVNTGAVFLNNGLHFSKCSVLVCCSLLVALFIQTSKTLDLYYFIWVSLMIFGNCYGICLLLYLLHWLHNILLMDILIMQSSS